MKTAPKIVITAIVLTAIISLTQVNTYVINPDVTQATIQNTICKKGWTATIRPSSSYTNRLKVEQLKSPIFTDKEVGHYEEDHRLSLELGGHPTDPKNLVPQPYSDSVAGIKVGAQQKDVVETYLNHQVCSGKMTLKDAQDSLVNNWAKIYLGLKGYEIEPSSTDN